MTIRSSRHLPGKLAAAAMVFLLSLAACSRSPEPEERTGAAATARSAEPTGANAAGNVELDAGTQRAVGIQTETLSAIEVTPGVEAYGRVLDPAPLAALVHELTAAQATLAASQQELLRAQKLLGENNASERAVQAAQAAAGRDLAQMQAVRDRIALGWGTALARRANFSALVDDLTALKARIVRLDLPLGEPLPSPPGAARLTRTRDDTVSTAAELLGAAPSTDAQLQTQGLLYLVKDSSLRLPTGSAVIGHLPATSAPPLLGVRLPAAAVIRYEALPWVYVQTDDTHFRRTPLSTLHAIDGGWLVPRGLRAGDRVVTAGAQILLSEELKSQVRLED
jgi:multidrug efflux system membrane fusion protein